MIRFPPGVDPTVFLREYWQQKPLFIPCGLEHFVPPVNGDDLAGLALESDIESRLVVESGASGPWEVRHGPFSEEDFATLPATPWTLLVQGVDLWVPEVRALIDRFSFLPRWRIDDIMVSFANDGGSVGPHFDYYDVFLIQGEGRRHWHIGDRCDHTTPVRTDTGLRIVETFDPRQSWELVTGDILYLPPGIAHHGVALGNCTTYSVGFRAPTAGEMLDDLATEVLSIGGGHHYRDPPLSPAMASETIDPAFIEQARQLLLSVLDDRQLLTDWFAAYMTRPKYQDILIDDPALDRRARTPDNRRLFINGDADTTSE